MEISPETGTTHHPEITDLTDSGIFDICIVGAGVAGAALAAHLGKKKFQIALIEKDLSLQDRIVGELLQPGGVLRIQSLGLGESLEGIDAQPVYGYSIFLNGNNLRISYPEVNSQILTGRGFRNGKFVQNLRSICQKTPSIQVISGHAQNLVEEEGLVSGVEFTTTNGDTRRVRAHLTIVCDGFFSTFRRSLSLSEHRVTGNFLGLIMKNCPLVFPNHGHVFITKGSPFLVYPIASNEVRALIDFEGQQPPRKGGALNDYLLHQIAFELPEVMRPSFIEAVEEGKFKVMPNHILPARPKLRRGAMILGDALNMRHPLTGGGMTAAFTDIEALGRVFEKLDSLGNADQVTNAIAGFYARQRRPNATINILADALYGVVKNRDLSDACFHYLQTGGKRASEPVSILAGIIRNRQLLEKHFFAVAITGAGLMLRPFPTISKMKRAYKMIFSAFWIIYPLILNERPPLWERLAMWVGRLFFPRFLLK